MEKELDVTGMSALKDKILVNALALIPFDGWSKASFETAADKANIDLATAYRIFPKGESDLANYFHVYGDQQMLDKLEMTDLSGLRYSEKIAEAVWFRVSAFEDYQVQQVILKKAFATFLVPSNLLPGTKLVWDTADKIWNFMGDTSEDYNWYTKRMILSGIVSSSLLFYIGDNSEEFVDTRDFINRRIADVMEFEKIKSQARNNPLFKPIFKTLENLPKRQGNSEFDKSKYPGWVPDGGNTKG